MTTVLIAGLASACVLTAVEGLLISLGKWRGLLSLIMSTTGILVMAGYSKFTIFEVLAATFVGLVLSLAVEQVFTGVSLREVRNLPKRVDRL
jgi:uncharacterized protein involved in cysteine biosynthesis